MPRKKSPEAEARDGMKTLGVYKAEFEPMIRAYGQLREQYDALTLQYEESGYSFQVETDSGAKKAPIVTTLESLRRDVLTYASQLGLTPAGLKKLNEASMKPAKTSPLADALRSLEGRA